MKQKITLSLIAALVLQFTYGLGYWSGVTHTRKSVRMVVARDTSDSQQSSCKTEYEPYFTKQNRISDKVK